MTQFRPSRFEILPLVVKNLVIINVLFLIAQNTIGKSEAFPMFDIFALHHVQSSKFQPWQIVTHMFLHANFWHLFGNMFGLWVFGARLESLWGPRRFLTFYFLCGIGAALIQLTSLWFVASPLLNDFAYLRDHLSFNSLYDFSVKYLPDLAETLRQQPTINDPAVLQSTFAGIQSKVDGAISGSTVGASGAVYGVIAAFVYLFPNDLLYLYAMIPIKAKFIGLVYLGLTVYGLVQDSRSDNTAHWAHLGGALVGFLLVLTWNKSRKRFY